MKVLVLMFLIAMISLLAGTLGYIDCEDDDIYGLQGHCGKAVWMGAAQVVPSIDCCHFVKERTSLACVCENVVTPRHEKYISMKKLARVAGYCGVPLKPGTNCGSYKVPPETRA